MNLQTHRVIFNKSRGCMMAVSEVASSTGKCKSGKSRKSRTKRCKHLAVPVSSPSKPNLGHFYPSNKPLAQSVRAQAATDLIAVIAPGIALSAEQMALLTSDIVWLERKTITLADGSTAQVIAPQVYLRKLQTGDISPTGALTLKQPLAAL